MGGTLEDTGKPKPVLTHTHYCIIFYIINEELHRRHNTQKSEFEKEERKSCEEQVSRELVSVLHYRDTNTAGLVREQVFLVKSI